MEASHHHLQFTNIVFILPSLLQGFDLSTASELEISVTMSTITTRCNASVDGDQSIDLETIEYPSPSFDSKSIRRRADGSPKEEDHLPTKSLINADAPSISNLRASVVIGTVACISLINSMLGGLLVVSLPTMASDLDLSQDLLLWPAGVNALACGCTLLLSGSIADVVGGRKVYLIGIFSLTMTTIACGLCRTGLELIIFRAVQGVAVSLCLPSSVILITSNIPTGTYRNTAFACLGAGQPLGFSVGLVLGGVFIREIGWRYGYYIGAILTFITFIISIFGIPADNLAESQSARVALQRINTEIDWMGCLLLSTSLGMFSYVLSVLASGISHFLAPTTITMFSIAVLLLPIFVWYSYRQERFGRKVIIPPSLWRNYVFTSLCLTIFVVWGVFNSVELFLTLYYQIVEQLSPIETSIRFLPMVVSGTVTNVLTGWLVKRVRADVLVMGSAIITALGPLLMALNKTGSSYWTYPFVATACMPICADVLFTVGNLVITSVFPPQTHGLAGGVFNTISNIGQSVGLAITAVVASSVTIAEKGKGEIPTEMLMDGYRATFWLCFGASVLVLGVIGSGLRKIGKVGIKQD